MTSFEFNDDAIKAFESDLQQKFAASEGQFPIPRDSSLEEIEQVITAQLESIGATPDVAAVKAKAVEMHAAFADGSL